MADVKISGLPASTTPLAGTEVLPIVQGGVTKQVSVTNLTAGKTVLATAFDTDVAAAAVTLSGTTLAADGTDTNISLGITPKGSGGVGVNGSPSGVIAGGTVNAKFCVKQNEDGPVAAFVKAHNTNAAIGSTVFACRSRGTLTAPTIVQNNDVLATYLALGFDGTDLAIAADIEFQVDGVPGSNDMPGRILFKTTPDGTQTPVEAMRIDSTQKVTFADDVEVGGTFSITGTFIAAGGYAAGAGALVTEATTARTLTAADNGKIIYCTNGATTTITCAAGLGAGFSVTIIQGGAGKVTVAAGGQTLVSYSSLFSTMGQYAVISLVCPVADTFVAAGNLGV
jgi:hypothetical protein